MWDFQNTENFEPSSFADVSCYWLITFLVQGFHCWVRRTHGTASLTFSFVTNNQTQTVYIDINIQHLTTIVMMVVMRTKQFTHLELYVTRLFFFHHALLLMLRGRSTAVEQTVLEQIHGGLWFWLARCQ